MEYGVNTLLWTAGFDRSHLHTPRKIKEAGFDGVEPLEGIEILKSKQ